MPPTIVFIHLMLIIPCIILGAILILGKRGSNFHKNAGKIYLVLMGITGILTLFIPAQVGHKLFNHFGGLHLLSLLTLWTVPKAWLAIRKGDIKTHKNAMIRLYIGGIIIAGGFAIFAEGRYLNTLFFK